MTDRFRIRKDDDLWLMEYTPGFDEKFYGELCLTFEHAVQAFVAASERRCPDCLKGAVVDMSWGWECAACGSHDVAVGCTRP